MLKKLDKGKQQVQARKDFWKCWRDENAPDWDCAAVKNEK